MAKTPTTEEMKQELENKNSLWHGSSDPSWIDRGESFDANRPANAQSKYLFLSPRPEVAKTYAGISDMQQWKADNSMGKKPTSTAGIREFIPEKKIKTLKVKDVKKTAKDFGFEWSGSNPLETLLDAAKAAGYDAVKMEMDANNIAVLNPEKFKHKPVKKLANGGQPSMAEMKQALANQGASHYIIHAGSDFNDIDPSYFGRGEGSSSGMKIRPLGNGLYGYLARDPDEAKRAVKLAREYLKYAPTKDKAIHAFKASINKGDVRFKSGIWDKNLLAELTPEEKMRSNSWKHASSLPIGEERKKAFAEHLKQYPTKTMAQTRAEDAKYPYQTEHLSGPNLVEIAAHDPKRLSRAGKWHPDTSDEDIVKDLFQRKAGGGSVAPSVEQMKLALNEHGMYSPLEKAALAIPRTKGTPAEFMAEASKQPGFRKEEVEDRKVALPQQKMTKPEFMGHLQKHAAPKIAKKVLQDFGSEEEANEAGAKKLYREDYDDLDWEERKKVNDWAEQNSAQYKDYAMPGGDNYREVLLQAPHFDPKKNEKLLELKLQRRRANPTMQPYFDEDIAKLEAEKASHGPEYKSSHYSHPNILAHMRLSDREGPDGEKLLHLDELQSDWHQAGRKRGYDPKGQEGIREWADKMALKHGTALYGDHLSEEDKAAYHKVKNSSGIPDAPFKKNWHEMALKHALHEAAKGGYHGLVITPGQEQADRYDLSKQVGQVHYEPNTNILVAFDPEGKVMSSNRVKPADLDEHIGKDAAEKLLAAEPSNGVHVIEGDDLKVGGEGMKGFYDKIIPDYLNKLGKKHGVKVGQHHAPESKTPLHHFPINDSMREQILKEGLPMYKEGGDVHKAKGDTVKAKKPSVEEMKQAIFQKNQAGLMKPSEVLGQHEDKYLHLTEADRAKVENIKNGLRGGVKFSQIGHTDPAYEGRVWGVGKSGVVTKLLNKEKRGLPADAKSIWSTFIGSPDMHTSNQLVFNRMWNKFQEAKKAGLLTPEIEAQMLDMMRSSMTAEKAGSPSKPVFDPDVTLNDSHHLFDTFERRRILSDLMAGKKIGGKKGQIFDAKKVIEDSTEPSLLHAPTFSVGPHLFEFNRESSHEPHLNKAFPFMLHGTSYPEAFKQTPMELIAPDYVKGIRDKKGRDPGYMDIVRNIPRQHINETMLTNLQKAGYAKGGNVKTPTIDQMREAISKASGSKSVPMAEKSLTTVDDFRQSMKDSMQDRMAERQNTMESMPYKYDKGHHVFTKWTADNNKPPYKILGRTISGGQPMRHPKTMKPMRDENGKPMKTPIGPGYHVRYDNGPDDWHESTLPEHAILGHLADGGMVVSHLADGGQPTNSIDVKNIGVNEAPNMAPKHFFPPDSKNLRMPSPGGVATPSGMPIGGVDADQVQPGQQLMQAPQGQPPMAPPQGTPQNPGAPAGAGPTPPMGNMLQMTPQGQTMAALGGAQPPAPPQGLAEGGQPEKVYTHRVIDPKNNNAVMGKYTSLKSAIKARDRLDNQYGAYRYKHEAIPETLAKGGNIKKGVVVHKGTDTMRYEMTMKKKAK